MHKLILLFFILSILFIIPQAAQQIDNTLPKIEQQYNSSGETRSVTLNEPEGRFYIPEIIQQGSMLNNSAVRWTFFDPIAVGNMCATSANGLYQAVGWDLNTKRISVYDNNSSVPLWEFSANSGTNVNFVAVSGNGDYIASGSYHNIYVFNRSSNTPVFNFNLETQLPDTGSAGPVDITSDGGFIVASASRSDSSWIFGFNRNSTNWVWRYRVGQINAGGASIQGVRISGNDSLVIVNTYMGFYVFRTYTGQLVYSGVINPNSNSGTQFPQGISGNGNYIATINYSGNIRIYQWNGSTYNFLWQHSEGSAWMCAVDISYDGTMIACGTLNFLGGSNYDGKIKFFNTSSSTPVWTYPGCGDEVTSVSFSKNGRILAASTWGDLGNAKSDLIVFKTSVPAAAPIFEVNTPGSLYWCSVSDDGSTVITAGKRIHARTFGNGGEAYNVFIDTGDVPLSIGINNNTASGFKLYANYPNPFNPATIIKFNIPLMSGVSEGKGVFTQLKIYDVTGREVFVLVNDILKPGEYSADWNASNFASGVYYYKITAGNPTSGSGQVFSETRKMVLLK